MPDKDLFLQAIDTVYASGLDRDRLPEALNATSCLLGAAGATLEIFDKPAQRLAGFWSAGLPQVSQARYVEHFAALNPRVPMGLRQRAGDLGWDHQIFDEAAMSRDPFYADFLPALGLRYFISAVLEQTPERLVIVSVQRTRKQGHVDKRGIVLMRRLCPHFQRAHDLTTRLSAAGDRRGLLENALDWLTDGVAMLQSDGRIVYANDALRALAQRGDGFRITGCSVEFATADARHRFGNALAAVAHIGDASFDAYPTDFPVARSIGTPAYIVSVRPLAGEQKRDPQHADAVVMLLVHDPLGCNIAAGQMLQELYNLTHAETHLAQALCTGMTTGAYARERHVTLNTVYSHLRRIREKTGCKSVPELIRKFSEMNVPLRLS